MRALTAAFVAAFLLSASAAAQDRAPACGARAAVLAWLAQSYREAPVALGVTGGGGLIELLTSSGGATWTLIVTSPRGRTCLLAAGEGWRPPQPPRKGPKA